MDVCVNEGELIRLVAGELQPEQANAVSAHLAGCPACSARYRAMVATWDLLGAWQVQAPESQIRESIRAAAAKRRSRPEWVPLAASVLLAVGLGTTTALLRSAGTPPPPPTAQVSTEQIVEILGLDALGEDVIAVEDVFGPADGTTVQEEHS